VPTGPFALEHQGLGELAQLGLDLAGTVLATHRVGDGLARGGKLHGSVAAHAEQPGKVARLDWGRRKRLRAWLLA
jgi:hypothetical protein